MNRDLSSQQEWESTWEGSGVKSCGQLDHRRPGFHRDLHRLVQEATPALSGGESFLELGCYPGRFMRYFHDLGYTVDGLEYVEQLAPQTTRLLADVGVKATVHHGDFRDWRSDASWDLVASFGLVEHFEDTADVLRHHARHCREGGHILITFPLHCGVYGKVMKWASPDRLAQHNRMSLDDVVDAASRVEGLDVVRSAYLGRFGFGASRLHNRLDEWFPGSKALLGIPLRITERTGRRVLPNTRSLSPFAGMVCRVSDQSALMRGTDARSSDCRPI